MSKLIPRDLFAAAAGLRDETLRHLDRLEAALPAGDGYAAEHLSAHLQAVATAFTLHWLGVRHGGQVAAAEAERLFTIVAWAYAGALVSQATALRREGEPLAVTAGALFARLGAMLGARLENIAAGQDEGHSADLVGGRVVPAAFDFRDLCRSPRSPDGAKRNPG